MIDSNIDPMIDPVINPMINQAAPPPEPITLEPDRMSEVLLRFADPAQDVAAGRHSYRSAITLAVLAWNISLLPEAKRERVLESRLGPLMSLYSDTDQGTVRQIIEMLIQRRLREFGGDHGFIVGFELDDGIDPPSLSVSVSGGGAGTGTGADAGQ